LGGEGENERVNGEGGGVEEWRVEGGVGKEEKRWGKERSGCDRDFFRPWTQRWKRGFA